MARASLLLVLFSLASAARGEICRFRAFDGRNPFSRWLASQEVTCDAVSLRVPQGLWNVFERGEHVVSGAPMLIEGPAASVAHATELVAGAVVMPMLAKGQTGVIYAPKRGIAFPVDAARLTVPADEPLWLFVLARSEPVAMIPIAPLVAGTERSVDARNGGPAAVIGWLQIPDDDLTALASATAISSPQIHIGAHDADALPRLSLLHGAFYRIRDVAPGEAELRVEGHNWVASRRTVRVKAGLTALDTPLLLQASGTLTVHWNTLDDLAALDHSLGSCTRGDPAPGLVIAISKCPSVRSEDSECTPVREELVDRSFGSLAIDDIAPGLYQAEMRFGKLPPAFGQARVGALQNADLNVFATYVTAAGKVTRGGEPLGEAVKLEFAQGSGFAPEDSDEFYGVMRPPGVDVDSQVKVAACDGSPHATVLVDRPMTMSAPLTIDIPANELAIHVTDTFTGQGLPGASVRLEAMSARRHDDVALTINEMTNGDGRLLWSAVPVRLLRIAITRPGYEKYVVEPFTIERSGRHTIEAEMVPLRGFQGKIESGKPFEAAMVYWFSAAGIETEHADVDSDGTFVYENWHAPEETMSVVSASHPLWILRTPATARRQAITMRFPPAPVATFDVGLAASIPPGEERFIGIAIGELHVPQPVLTLHQRLRRESPVMVGTGLLHVRDILATAPIAVILGPCVADVPPAVRETDIFAIEKYARRPREPLEPNRSHVVLTIDP